MFNRIVCFVCMFCLFQNVNAQALVNATDIQQPASASIEPVLNVEIVLNQQELEVDVPDSSAVASQFGLLGALIGAAVDNAKVKNAEQRIVAIRDQMVGYNFNEKFEAAARAALATPGISPNPQIRVVKSAWDPSLDEVKPRPAQELTALVVTPRYSISNNFEQISLSMNVHYVVRTLKPNGKVKQSLIFTRLYRFNIPMDTVSGSMATEDSNRWAALGKQQLTDLADQSIKQVTDMLAFDFSTEGRALSAQSNKGLKATFKGKEYAGRTLRQTEDFIWVQTGKNMAQSIQGYQPISGLPASASAAPAPVEATNESIDSTTQKK